MTEVSEINFGFFKKESVEVKDALQVEIGLIYDFSLENSNLELIMDTLRSPDLNEFCILCQVKNIMEKQVIVRLLYTTDYSEDVYPNLNQIYVNDTEYLLAGTIAESISTLTPAFIHTLKANGMIGVCCISVKLLGEKISTWMKEKRSLSEVLTNNVFGDPLVQHLSDKDIKKLRLVSKETKRIIDMKRPLVIFEQSKLPVEFNFRYTSDTIKDLCSKYGRKPEDCALHIIYGIDIGTRRKIKVPVTKILDTKEKEIFTFVDRKVLAESDIKLSIKIMCFFKTTTDTELKIMFNELCSIIRDLKRTIYSLEIHFIDNYLIRNNYDNFVKVLREIPNLKILKLFNVYIRWKPFLECIKNIKTLEELSLSNVRMMTNLSDRTAEDPDPEDFNKKFFENIFSDSLKHLKSIRIDGNDCVVTTNEENETYITLYLLDVLVAGLKDLPNLRSLGFNYTQKRIGAIIFTFALPYTGTEHLDNITRLDLSGSDLVENKQDFERDKRVHKMNDIADILMCFVNLKEHDLSNSNINMEHFKHKSIGSIESGRGSSRRDRVLPSLMETLKLSGIRYLNLSNNNFSIDDIKEIKAYFKGFVFVDTHIDGQEEPQEEEPRDLDELD